jgi:predicted nucleic acid-binding Zn ribbon protein
MPTYVYTCKECGHSNDAYYSLKDNRPDSINCGFCDKGIAHYQLKAPTVLRASYLDGQRKKEWQDLREASKLNRAAAGTDNQTEKKELQAEQKKLGYNFTKDTI